MSGHPSVQAALDRLGEQDYATQIGERIAEMLNLRKIRGNEAGRYRTTWGTKTAAGLARTVSRVVLGDGAKPSGEVNLRLTREEAEELSLALASITDELGVVDHDSPEDQRKLATLLAITNRLPSVRP